MIRDALFFLHINDRMSRLVLMALGLTLPSSLHAAEKPLTELEREANAVLSDPDNVARRKRIAPVFELADRYAALGQTNKALSCYARALEHQPWNLDAQLAMAGLLRGTGDLDGARQKAELVWNHAETDALLRQAAKLLDKPFPSRLPDQVPEPTEPYVLTLVPDDGTDLWLLLALREDLSRMLGIPVIIREVALAIPKPGRDPVHLRAEDLRGRIARSLMDAEFRSRLVRLKLSTDSLTNDEAVFTFSAKILESGPDQEPARRFKEELAFLRRLGPQWDSTALLEQLAQSAGARPGSGMGYLGVTPRDLYADESRYVFGLAAQGQNCGIFSYRRFTSVLLDAPPNRGRLKERALKQALSSVGLMFGLPRCTDPTCARAYANSLEEHDAKQLRLCPQCQEGFSKRFSLKPAEGQI